MSPTGVLQGLDGRPVNATEPYKYPAKFSPLWLGELLLARAPVSLAPGFLTRYRRKFITRAFVMAKNIEDARARQLPDDLSFSVLEPDDIRFVASHPEARNGIDYQDRVAAGDVCYGIKRGDELLTYNWIRFHQCCVFCSYPWEIGFLPTNEQQAFTYDFYTYKAHRKQGLGSLLKACLLADLRARGIREVLSVVYRTNFASLSIHLRMGYDVRYLFNGYQLLDWSTYRLIPAQELPALDAWLALFRESKHIAQGIHP